ncbi:hypothetical protein FOZ62_007424, partial [Perkinsus olseni]
EDARLINCIYREIDVTDRDSGGGEWSGRVMIIESTRAIHEHEELYVYYGDNYGWKPGKYQVPAGEPLSLDDMPAMDWSVLPSARGDGGATSSNAGLKRRHDEGGLHVTSSQGSSSSEEQPDSEADTQPTRGYAEKLRTLTSTVSKANDMSRRACRVLREIAEKLQDNNDDLDREVEALSGDGALATATSQKKRPTKWTEEKNNRMIEITSQAARELLLDPEKKINRKTWKEKMSLAIINDLKLPESVFYKGSKRIIWHHFHTTWEDQLLAEMGLNPKFSGAFTKTESTSGGCSDMHIPISDTANEEKKRSGRSAPSKAMKRRKTVTEPEQLDQSGGSSDIEEQDEGQQVETPQDVSGSTPPPTSTPPTPTSSLSSPSPPPTPPQATPPPPPPAAQPTTAPQPKPAHPKTPPPA